MNSLNFDNKVKHYVSLTEDSLRNFLPDANCAQGSVTRAMEYSLMGGGKRIRAILLLAAAEALGCDPVKAAPFTAAIEMIHAYSLIHDDLPCMDDDDMRRGKPSCHIAFGEDIALLAGDALLTLAFEICSDKGREDDFGADKALAAVNIISRAAGWAGMVGGQIIDLESEGKTIKPETLLMMDEKKTGALISAAVKTGCALGGATAAVTGLMADYALKLGVAFQIVDDILDVISDEKLLGKPVCSDIENGKSTYVTLFGVEGAKKLAEGLSREAKECLIKTGLDVDFLLSLTDMLLERKY